MNPQQLARILWVLGMAALIVSGLDFLAVISLPAGPLPPLVIGIILFIAGYIADRRGR